MGCSLSASSVHGILPAKILEWIAFPYSRGSSQPRDQTRISYVSCFGSWALYTSTTWEVPIVGIVGKNPVVHSEDLGSSSANTKSIITFPSTVTAASMITSVSVF